MGKRYEIKRLDSEFEDKCPANGNITPLMQALKEAEQTINSCNEAIEAAGLAGISYTSQTEEIEDVTWGAGILMSYVVGAQDEVSAKLDQSLYTGFKNSATETISNIKLEDISTENTFHMESYYTMYDTYSTKTEIREKSSLTFKDFLGVNQITEDEKIGALQNVAGMQEFSSMFQEDYDRMVEEGQLVDSGIDSVEEYLDQLMEVGQFDHKEYHPVLNVLSGLLDITIIKPLIEACVGQDLLTGEQLSDFERGMKAVFAIVDVATLGIALGATELATLGTKEALMIAGRTAAYSMVSDAAAYTVGTLGDELGLPLPITLLLSMGSGITVSKSLDKVGSYVIKNKSGEVLGEIAGEALDDTKTLDTLVDETDQTLEDLVKKAGVELDELELSKNVDGITDNVDITKNNSDSLTELMSDEAKEKYERFLKYGSIQGFTDAEIYALLKVDEAIALNKVDYDEVLELKKAANKVEDSIITDELLGDSKKVNKISEGVSNYETYTPTITNVDDIDGNMLKLRRTYDIDDVKVEMQSGHAYYREHKGGAVKDFATIDEAENAVLSDFAKKMQKIEIKLPHGGDVSIELNGKTLVYRSVWIEKLNIFSVNYFPKK